MGCACLILIGILASVIFGGYNEADTNGWVPHTADVDLYMDPNWLVGENRDCLGMHSAPEKGLIKTLFCPSSTDNQEKHNLQIKFWGKTMRPFSGENNPSAAVPGWKCTRTADGFVCKALN